MSAVWPFSGALPGALADWIASHGYWVLSLGCLLEGETVLLMAGFAAHRGLLDPWAVLAVASAGGFVGDQIYFWLGRRHGAQLLARRPAWAAQAARVQRWALRWDGGLVIGLRFAWGLRVAGPVLLGASPMSAVRFAAYNALGAVIWACVVGGAGWLFGHAAETLLGELRHLEGWLLAGLLVLGLAVWWWRRRRR